MGCGGKTFDLGPREERKEEEEEEEAQGRRKKEEKGTLNEHTHTLREGRDEGNVPGWSSGKDGGGSADL